jgi:hypothetical protein
VNYNLKELESLPLETQLLSFHEFSEEAFQGAAQATTELERADLIELGNYWRSLAIATERTLREQRSG